MDRAEAVIPAQGSPTGSPAGRASAPAGDGTRASSAPARSRLRAPGVRLDPYLLATAFFVAYVLLSVTRYRRMLTMSWDLGIFEQAVKSYAHLHAPTADLKGPGFDILGDHFSPITTLIAPFYRVFPTPVTLLVAQAVLFAVSVIPVTRVAARLLGRGRGLAIGVAYGLSWGVQKAVEFDFHEIAFAMPLLAFSLEAVLLRRWAAAMGWAVPLVFVKEDMGVTAAAIGVIVWWRVRQEPKPEAAGAPGADGDKVRDDGGHVDGDAARDDGGRDAAAAEPSRSDEGGGARGDGTDTDDTETDADATGRHEPLSDRLRYGPWAIGLAAFGVAASALAFGVIIPAFNKAGGYDYWNKLNGNGAPMPGHIPFGTAVHTLLWILLPTSGLLALRSPLILAALPTIGWRFVSHDDHYWGTDWHYSAVLMPVVVLALVDAADRSRRSPMPWLRSYASGAPAAVAGAALALTLTLPLASLSHGDTYRVDARTKAIEHLLDEIPDGASVEANVGPISHLVSRTTVYWVGDTPGVIPDYIAIDNGDGWAGDPATYATQLHPGVRYTPIGAAEGYVVLHRT
ncbi:DUF2079 domain-containing protein [Actinacidiphila sp. DG2A-62]|uniref:DUF2079 domain-containing protein n=1 Tax=Actinacidiphila sp. DG2A-62 TaxID=3108821 RepID=UPI002DBC67FC|nr:DUF2079 domain-containing protein [Actinacidiphila sp. DG2A-62]MEC3994584.1 DUF2079 domain-containing protein [Actinacidiphila sp. DG2A-62]